MASRGRATPTRGGSTTMTLACCLCSPRGRSSTPLRSIGCGASASSASAGSISPTAGKRCHGQPSRTLHSEFAMKLLTTRRARAAAESGAHGCSVLAAGLTVVGDIETGGTVRIDGRLEGSVRRAGSIIIGVDAVVQGNVSAREVVVGGSVQGNINAVDRVELQPTSV